MTRRKTCVGCGKPIVGKGDSLFFGRDPYHEECIKDAKLPGQMKEEMIRWVNSECKAGRYPLPQGGTMKVEKAIEVLTQDLTCDFHGSIEDWHGALHLGIEALERLQENRRDPEFDHWMPLPGETPPPDSGDE